MKNRRQTRTTVTRKQKNISKIVTGVLEVNNHGVGFVSLGNSSTDIKIHYENIGNALHGDTVEVGIFAPRKINSRPEGKVIKIITRNTPQLIGTVECNATFAFVKPDSKNYKKDIFINEKNSIGLKNGDRVIVKVTEWTSKSKSPNGEIVEILNAFSESDIAMKEILLHHGFTLNFPKEVLEELEQIKETIDAKEIAQRKNLRNVFTITIDPVDAKDFDDAISLQTLTNGNIEIGIHIADVSHYVTPNTALDKEAAQRTTSVYLPDRVLPMLPEKISNELCSLRPQEDKLTFSAVFEYNTKSELVNEWFGKTIIHSNRRYTYEEVQEIIEGKQEEHQDKILFLNTFSQALRKKRFDSGAINFNSEEVRFQLDEQGVPIAVVIKTSKESHQLIEELMLLANKQVATFVNTQKINNAPIVFPYRIHDTPDIEKLKVFSGFAATFGYSFNYKSSTDIAKSFNTLIEKSNAVPEHKILQQLGIRTMAKAIYSSENIGHYGLCFENYCHFTSPIRRYPDVLVHRILQNILTKIPAKNWKGTGDTEIYNHCSVQERKAMDAERDANKYKQVEFIQKHVGSVFDAVISGVASHGFWAETIEHKCEGYISLGNLTHIDEFKFVEAEYALVGYRKKIKFQIGQKIKVLVAATSVLKRQVDFELI